MAEKRMFSKKIIDTDWFMDMPHSSQNLYFHLSMRADDDGFVASPKRIIKLVGSTDDDYRILISKKFIIPFDSGVCVITDWRINNYLRNDRYAETVYKEEKNTLTFDENGKYISGIPAVDLVSTDSNSLSKFNLSIDDKENKQIKHKYGEYKRVLLTDVEYDKLCNDFGKEYIDKVIIAVDEYVESNNNKNKYANFNIVIRNAIRQNWSIVKNIPKDGTNAKNYEKPKEVTIINGRVYE